MNIPEKIEAGYNTRRDTYSGKLAYVTWINPRGKRMKEPSWEKWRDKKLGSDIYDNTPLEGFVLNKKAGDYTTHWNKRSTYARVHDPRGFEVELTIENLLYILDYADCLKGKGLEGEFVYGMEGRDLWLIPITSPIYKDSIVVKSTPKESLDQFTTPSKLIVGNVYELHGKGKDYTYMGKYPTTYTAKTHHTFARMGTYTWGEGSKYLQVEGWAALTRKVFKPVVEVTNPDFKKLEATFHRDSWAYCKKTRTRVFLTEEEIEVQAAIIRKGVVKAIQKFTRPKDLLVQGYFTVTVHYLDKDACSYLSHNRVETQVANTEDALALTNAELFRKGKPSKIIVGNQYFSEEEPIDINYSVLFYGVPKTQKDTNLATNFYTQVKGLHEDI